MISALLTGCSNAPTQPAGLPLSIGPIRAERVGWDMVFTAYVRNHRNVATEYSTEPRNRGFNVVVKEVGNTPYYVWRAADILNGPSLLLGASVSIPPHDSIAMSVRWTAVAEPGVYEMHAEIIDVHNVLLGRTDQVRPLEIRLPSSVRTESLEMPPTSTNEK